MTLKAYLEHKNLTQSEAARQLRISVDWIGKLVRRDEFAGRKLANRIEFWSGGEVTIKDLWRL